MKTDTTTGALRPVSHTHRKAPFDGPGSWWIDRDEGHPYAVLSVVADDRAHLVIRFPPELAADNDDLEDLAARAVERVAATFKIRLEHFEQTTKGLDTHLHAKPYQAQLSGKQAA